MGDDDLSGGVHTVTADDVPFDAYWLHWSTLRTWPLHLAVAWAAYPSCAEIVQQGQQPTGFPREAEKRAEVLVALMDGRLVAYGVPHPGNPWDPAIKIPADQWRDLQLRDSRTLSEPAMKIDGKKVAFRSVEIETSRLFDLWPNPEMKYLELVHNAPKVRRTRGRPATVTPDLILKMLAYLRAGGTTEGMTGAALSSQFGGSENTAMGAWDSALAEFHRGNS